MTSGGHLWAIGYRDMERAEQVRPEIQRLGEQGCLILLDTAVAVRWPDGFVTLDGEPMVAATTLHGHGLAGFFARLALGAPPLTGPAAGALVRGAGGVAPEVGIDDAFVSEVEALMKPGTSTLFVLDEEGDMSAILNGIRGLGGTIVRTNVNLDRARLIQSTLASSSPADLTKTDAR
jgi:uncharacterized membrane protein